MEKSRLHLSALHLVTHVATLGGVVGMALRGRWWSLFGAIVAYFVLAPVLFSVTAGSAARDNVDLSPALLLSQILLVIFWLTALCALPVAVWLVIRIAAAQT